MTAVNKAHSVSNDKANVIVVIRILEYVLPLPQVKHVLTIPSAPFWLPSSDSFLGSSATCSPSSSASSSAFSAQSLSSFLASTSCCSRACSSSERLRCEAHEPSNAVVSHLGYVVSTLCARVQSAKVACIRLVIASHIVFFS